MSLSLTPARVAPPGRILVRELEARAWTQKDLAQIIGRPEQAISEIVKGTKQITADTALELAEAFGTSPEFWTNLEANYRVWVAQRAKRMTHDGVIARKSRLYSLAPIPELMRRNWIRATNDLDSLEREVCRFFGIRSTFEEPRLAVSFRHSHERGPQLAAEIAWTRRVEQIARNQQIGTYDAERLRTDLSPILACAEHVDSISCVPPALLKLGIHFCIVPHLPKTYLDGAALYVDGRPVIALTLRYNRVDAFWFTLLHELAHLAAGHKGAYLDHLYDTDTANLDTEETEANNIAGNWLVASEAYARFVHETMPRFSRARIEHFARNQHLHPGIALGRLHHDKLVPYRNLRMLLVPVKQYLEPWIDSSATTNEETAT